MIDADPTIHVRDLLDAEWDATNTSGLDFSPHTGWYDFGRGGPQVTVTNMNSTVIDGGATAQTAGTGDGGAVQVRAGFVLVNGWAGTRDDLRGAGSGGGDINPKAMAFQLGSEIHRIVQNHASGTDEFISLGADGIRSLVETDAPEVVYRQEVTVRFTHRESTVQS